ncbi:MAG: sulfotransferase [Bacteroidales bacterium]|nr:sulfotransferase [Bacteroidales bacterium]MCF8405863.1 sulfotransferase [Bacteroidales bacterium]
MIWILTGMHRSGTSMFARFMHESGINMGHDFYVDDTANKYGHFEDLDFLNLQRSELARLFDGEDWLVYQDFEPGEDFVRKSDELLQAKKAINNTVRWGWKDPRTTIFLEHWKKIDPAINYIFMVREPEAVVNSLCRLLQTKHNPIQKRKYMLAYIYYNNRILRFLQENLQQKTAVLSFEELTNDPEQKLGLLSKKLSYPFNMQLYADLFDKDVISADQSISYLFLMNLHKKAKAVHDRLKPYFI